jgi:hypothetical protein
VRFDERHDGVGRDRRVNSVATALEDLRAGLRRERLARGDDAERRGNLRAAGDNLRAAAPVPIGDNRKDGNGNQGQQHRSSIHRDVSSGLQAFSDLR